MTILIQAQILDYQITQYESTQEEGWDEFALATPMATFLHSRKYLSYHQDRFQDVSLMLWDKKGQLAALFPAAEDPGNTRQVVSHPGLTYGGLIHSQKLYGQRVLSALQAIRQWYLEHGFETLQYKAIPMIYHETPCHDDLYALFRMGATRYRCDLSSAIDLGNPFVYSERRSRGVKKARKHGLQVQEGLGQIEMFWQVLCDNLATRHDTRPVHTLDEFLLLARRFPQNIRLVTVSDNGQVVAGTVLFITKTVFHSQYIASSTQGQSSSALDLMFDYCIGLAKSAGVRYFDFGISNEQNGLYLNEGLYQFKSEFGGGGVVHEFYNVSLREPV
jgi:hypothetical protein